MKKIIITLFLIGNCFASFAQNSELEKELINALYECRGNFYELAENYYRLDTITQAEIKAQAERAEQAEQAARAEQARRKEAEETTRKRTKQRNAAAVSTLILIIINLLNR